MFSVETKTLDITQLEQTVLSVIEQVCEQFGLKRDFGYISLSSQIIADYLSTYSTKLLVDFSAYIDTNIVSLIFYANQASFKNFFNEFKEIEALRLLANSIEVSNDNKTLTLNFHVKPKPNYLNKTKLQKSIHQNAPLI